MNRSPLKLKAIAVILTGCNNAIIFEACNVALTRPRRQLPCLRTVAALIQIRTAVKNEISDGIHRFLGRLLIIQ
jgi:hypothetical protein